VDGALRSLTAQMEILGCAFAMGISGQSVLNALTKCFEWTAQIMIIRCAFVVGISGQCETC
jgi:hypothetical protein